MPFAHASEAEMSRILDFYAVRWEYEPHTFPILWNIDGDVLKYGKLALFEGLSGTSGQVAAPYLQSTVVGSEAVGDVPDQGAADLPVPAIATSRRRTKRAGGVPLNPTT